MMPSGLHLQCGNCNVMIARKYMHLKVQLRGSQTKEKSFLCARKRSQATTRVESQGTNHH